MYTFFSGFACPWRTDFLALSVIVLAKVMHDVVVQKLPVRMILDRAGLVGNDGPTHHGSFDLTYLGTLPHIVIMAPSDEVELMNMIQVQPLWLMFTYNKKVVKVSLLLPPQPLREVMVRG